MSESVWSRDIYDNNDIVGHTLISGLRLCKGPYSALIVHDNVVHGTLFFTLLSKSSGWISAQNFQIIKSLVYVGWWIYFHLGPYEYK